MQRRQPRRVWEVAVADFPIDITIEASNLSNCQAVVNPAIVLKNGQQMNTVPLALRPPLSTPQPTRSVRINAPQAAYDCIFIVMVVSFVTATSSNPSYTLILTAASGHRDKTTVKHPKNEDDTTVNIQFIR